MKTLTLQDPAKFGGEHSRERREMREHAVKNTSGLPISTEIRGSMGKQTLHDNTGDWQVNAEAGYEG